MSAIINVFLPLFKVTNPFADDDTRLSRERLAADLARMHVQWFASEDEGRTEDPTEHKIRKAREEGRVAKSQDLADIIVLIVTVVAFAIMAPGFLNTSADMVRYFLIQSTQIDPVHDRQIQLAFLDYFVKLSLPILVVAMVAALLGNIIQVGFLFTTKPLVPDFKKILPNFPAWIKRSFFSAEALYNLAKSFIKMLAIAGVTTVNIIGAFPRLMEMPRGTFMSDFGFIALLSFQVMVECAIVLLGFALFDWWFQRRQHKEALKMTPQEVKQERKEYDGDPLIKSRMRQRMRQILSQNMMANMPRADVVVTNPTHFAIAMEYKIGKMSAPEIVAKGADEVAFRIRELAKEYGIPIIENKPLARALYAEVDIGAAIPPKFYEAVVVVMKQVLRLKRQRKEVV